MTTLILKPRAYRLLLATMVVCLSLVGCASDDSYSTSDEEALYNEGMKAFRLNNWPQAIEILQLLEAQFPFGQYASQSQIELVYAYYMNAEPEATRAAADRFIRLHPDDPNVDYAYYMKGMSFYTEDTRLLGRWMPTDPSKRDPGKARESFADFSQLLNRYPNSPYAPDARARMIYLRNLLADYEVHVAEFYIQRQAYVSSLNRVRYVVENFQGAPAVPRAMEIMVEMYLRLGLNDLADTSLAVLKANYPESTTLDENGNFIVSTQITDPSFLYSVSFGLVGSNKKDAPLAPSKRPRGTQNSDPTIIERRSFWKIFTFGLLD